MSVTQVMEQYQKILEEDVQDLGWETGAFQRNGELDAATFVQLIIFGFWQEPEMRMSGLAQIGGRREVSVSPSAISQRFTAESATLFLKILQRLSEVRLISEKVETPFLKQFSAVVVEDSTSVVLPPEIEGIWRGCGGKEGMSGSTVKAFARWDVLTGELFGPMLTDGRVNDHKSPFELEDLQEGSVYLADLGFFGIERLCKIARGEKGKRYFVTRLQPKTNLYTRSGHLLNVKAILPKQVGQVKELGAVLGNKNGLPVRLLLLKVPDDVAKARQKRLYENAQKHGDTPSEEVLEMAHWTIVITNITRKCANYSQILVLVRLRWQIERLFRLWKEDGKIDEWRGKKAYRILCEFYAKMCAMVMQQSLIQEGCWLDPFRSIVKAAAAVRRECNLVMIAFYEGGLEKAVKSVLRVMQSGCRIDHRSAQPSTTQLLLDGLDWELEVLLA